MKQHLSRLLPILAIFVVSFLALGATLGAAVLAHVGATRVAVFASSETWARIEETGLPVVRLALGGLLIVVDGAGAPEALVRLRAGSAFVLDATMIPGCAAPKADTARKVSL